MIWRYYFVMSKLFRTFVALGINPFKRPQPLTTTTMEHTEDPVANNERVFTKNDVMAIMGPLVALSSARLSQVRLRDVEYVEAEHVEFAFEQLKAIAARLGLYSGPA